MCAVVRKQAEPDDPIVLRKWNPGSIIDVFSDGDSDDTDSTDVFNTRNVPHVLEDEDEQEQPSDNDEMVANENATYSFFDGIPEKQCKEFALEVFGDESVIFCPHVFIPVSYYITNGLGGMYPKIAEMVQSGLSTEDISKELDGVVDFDYDDRYNIMKVPYPVVDHMIFCTKLYLAINDIIHYKESSPKAFTAEVICNWYDRVRAIYDNYKSPKLDSKTKKILEQGLFELMWPTTFNALNPIDVFDMTYNFFWKVGLTKNYTDKSPDGLSGSKMNNIMINKIEAKADSQEFFIDGGYSIPYIDDSSFYRAVYAYTSVDPSMRDLFLENYTRLWFRYGSHIKIPSNTILARDLSTKYPDHAPLMILSVIQDTLNEGIKTKSHNIYLDDEGNILIEKKETSDFDHHFKNSTKLLKQYSKHIEDGGSADAYAQELAKLYFMAKIIEIHYMKQSSELTPAARKVQKSMINQRAVIINAFTQYLKIYTKKYPDFNFTEYFAHSKYGEVIKISGTEVQGTVKLTKKILSGLGLLR